MIKQFTAEDLKKLWKPDTTTTKSNSGQITIIGGSSLFHGAPILSLKAASRVVGMVYFSTPDFQKEIADQIKSKLASFIWVPFSDVDEYINKSDVILVGPGFMRMESSKLANSKLGNSQSPINQSPNSSLESQVSNNNEALFTKRLTEKILRQYPTKKFVLDAGAIQVIEPNIIPKNTIITPSLKEFEGLFRIHIDQGSSIEQILDIVSNQAKEFEFIIVLKTKYGSIVSDGDNNVIVAGHSNSMAKGGFGDIQAGLTSALYTKNDSLLAATSASFIIKETANLLEEERGFMFNADDLVDRLPEVFNSLS